MGLIRALIKLALFCLWTLLLVPLQYLFAAGQCLTRQKSVRQSPVVRVWYRGTAWLLGIRVSYYGLPSDLLPPHALYLSNHSSYLDIIVLGGQLPPFFVAKADTASWPVFGFLIKLGGTLFISRQRTLVKQQLAIFQQALQTGRQFLVFPEGTTSDGVSILPFKSSLLHVLYDMQATEMVIVPVCVTYQTINGHLFSAANNDLIAWYGEMELLPHLWRLFRQRSIAVRIDVLPAVAVSDYPDAKQLTLACADKISTAFAAHSPASVRNVAEAVAIDNDRHAV